LDFGARLLNSPGKGQGGSHVKENQGMVSIEFL
jgi:hypothetical protein